MLLTSIPNKNTKIDLKYAKVRMRS